MCEYDSEMWESDDPKAGLMKGRDVAKSLACNPETGDSAIVETCDVCTKEVKTQIMKGTGVCSDDCRKKRDGDTPHPATMPPHKPMGFHKATDELDGVLMDTGLAQGVDIPSIR